MAVMQNIKSVRIRPNGLLSPDLEGFRFDRFFKFMELSSRRNRPSGFVLTFPRWIGVRTGDEETMAAVGVDG